MVFQIVIHYVKLLSQQYATYFSLWYWHDSNRLELILYLWFHKIRKYMKHGVNQIRGKDTNLTALSTFNYQSGLTQHK